jgi:hypothetical protein
VPLPADRLLQRGWRTPPDQDRARDKAAELAQLVERFWGLLGHPCSEQVIDHALACARRRSEAFDPQQAVTVHGDAATANAAQVLTRRQGTEDGFVMLTRTSSSGTRPTTSAWPSVTGASCCDMQPRRVSSTPTGVGRWPT